MRTAWHELSHFQSRDNVAAVYGDVHHRELSATKAYAIVASVAQGEQYFRAAEAGDDLIRPLLLYYGAVALARAAILFRSQRLGEEGLSDGHGLTPVNWRQTLTAAAAHPAERIARIPDLRVRPTTGTFTSLAMAGANVETVGVLTRPTDRRQALNSSGPDTFDPFVELTLKDLLSRLPDISEPFARTFGTPGRCYEALVTYHRDTNRTEFVLFGSWHLGMPDEQVVRAAFHLPPWLDLHREVATGILRAGREQWRFVLEHPSEADLDALPLVLNDRDGQTFAVAAAPDEPKIVNLLTLYAVAFVLSNLVRYYPSIWFGLLTRSKGDFAFPILRATVDVVQDRFPWLILQMLRRQPDE